MRTDVRVLTIAITLGTSFLAVLMGVLLNNTRLTDVKVTLRSEMQALIAELRLLIERNHSELMLIKLADIGGRLSRIENEWKIVG